MGLDNKIKALFLNRLEAMKPKEKLVKALQKNAPAIIKLNLEQLDQGLTSTGEAVGVYRNYLYKLRFTPVDLLKTGAFRNRFFLKVGKEESVINSVDPKRKKLAEKYGEDIFGVQDKGKVADIVRNDFLTFCKKQVLP